MSSTTHPVDEVLPAPRLAALGIQHVLVMYAGAIAVPLIVGRALKLDPEQVAFLISADLFVCGIVTIIQSLGATQWFGIKLPVMMGVTFAAVGPMVAIANANPGPDGARILFGAIIGAGLIGIVIAPLASRMLRFFPPVVTGTIIVDFRHTGRPDRTAAGGAGTCRVAEECNRDGWNRRLCHSGHSGQARAGADA
jgi:xanthine/uracil permease